MSPDPSGDLPARLRANRHRATALVIIPALAGFVVALVIGFVVSGLAAGLVAGLVVAVASATAAWLSATRVVLITTGARPAGAQDQPRVHNLIEGLCAAAGLPKPSVYVVPDDRLNAFSAGRSPRRAAVTVTSGMVAGLDRMELEGVLAHELSHIKAGDIIPSTVAVNSLGWLLALLPSAPHLLESVVGPDREAIADLAAVSLTRYPPGLISALEKMTVADDGDGPPLRRSGLATRTTSHLWSIPWLTTSGSSGVNERIEALREL